MNPDDQPISATAHLLFLLQLTLTLSLAHTYSNVLDPFQIKHHGNERESREPLFLRFIDILFNANLTLFYCSHISFLHLLSIYLEVEFSKIYYHQKCEYNLILYLFVHLKYFCVYFSFLFLLILTIFSLLFWAILSFTWSSV